MVVHRDDFRVGPALPASAGISAEEERDTGRHLDVAKRARSMLRKREAMTRHLDPDLCVDPVIGILLFLLAEAEEEKRTTTADLCEAVAAPRTTVLRWIGRLEDRGLVASSKDAGDRRVTLLRLSADGRAALTAWVLEITT